MSENNSKVLDIYCINKGEETVLIRFLGFVENTPIDELGKFFPQLPVHELGTLKDVLKRNSF